MTEKHLFIIRSDDNDNVCYIVIAMYNMRLVHCKVVNVKLIYPKFDTLKYILFVTMERKSNENNMCICRNMFCLHTYTQT